MEAAQVIQLMRTLASSP